MPIRYPTSLHLKDRKLSEWSKRELKGLHTFCFRDTAEAFDAWKPTFHVLSFGLLWNFFLISPFPENFSDSPELQLHLRGHHPASLHHSGDFGDLGLPGNRIQGCPSVRIPLKVFWRCDCCKVVVYRLLYVLSYQLVILANLKNAVTSL